MAITQTAANKSGIAQSQYTDSDGIVWTPFGGVSLGVGTGTPNGVATAPIGSLFVELGSHELWMNTDAGTTWEIVGTQS